MVETTSDRAGSARWIRAAGILLVVLSALLFFSVARSSLALVGQPMAGFRFWDNGVLVALHDTSWTGARAGLPLNGGVVVGVDGQPFTTGGDLVRAVAAAPIGTFFEYDLRTGKSLETVDVPTMRFEIRDLIVTFGVYLVNGIALLATGALMVFLRFDAPAPRALAISTTVLGVLLLLAVDYMSTYRWIAACRLVEALAPAALANAALVFPTPVVAPRLRFGLVGVAAAVSLAATGFASLRYYEAPEMARAVASLQYVAIAVGLIGLVANYGYSLLYASSPRRRMQAAVVFAGGFPAFAMAAIGMLAFTLLGWSFSWSWVFALLPLAPISMLYAMVGQDIFDAEPFVRLSVGYTLATAAVIGLYAGVLGAADFFVLGEGLGNPAASLPILLLVALLFDPARRRVQRGVDRVFYRSRMDAARELERASEIFAELSDEAEIARVVAGLLERALGVTRAAVEPPGLAALPGRPGRSAADMDLAQPLRIGDEELGVLSCGPKRNGAPFSADERDFAKALADQAALAIHHARALADLREARDVLHRQERLAEVGEFAGAIAHGIRNPLAGIRAAGQMLLAGDPDETMRPSLENVVHEANRLELRVRSLLGFARPFSMEKKRLDLRALVRQVASDTLPFAQTAAVEVTCDLVPEPLEAMVDAASLREALLELATNAIRVMPEGGLLQLSVRRAGGGCEISVSDSGPGIPGDQLERVFDLFYTTRSEGTGIGLASARRVVVAHGGSIRAKSPISGGARFEIWLPPVDAPR